MLKTCSKCGEEKSLDCFNKDKSKRDGLNIYCKCCKSKSGKRYREENKELIIKRNKRYQEKNKELISNKAKKHYKENREVYAKRHKRYREENKETEAKRTKRWHQENKELVAVRSKKHREKNKELFAKRAKKHYEENRELIKYKQRRYYKDNKKTLIKRKKKYYQRSEVKERLRLRAHNRRALLKRLNGVLAQAEWDLLLHLYNNTCPRCRTKTELVMDHVAPVAWHDRFPTHITNDASNHQPLCRSCNASKRDFFAVRYLPVNYFEDKVDLCFWR